jgi:hypothetical protein
MTSATEIQKPMGRGAEDEGGEVGEDDVDGASEPELEKEGSGWTVIGGDGSTALPTLRDGAYVCTGVRCRFSNVQQSDIR